MHRHHRVLPPLAMIVFCATLGCGPKESSGAAATADKKPPLKNGLTEEQSQKVLAKVGDTVITVGQFADRLSAQSPYLRSRYASPERRREFLDSMVRFELLAHEARKRGLDKDEDVQRVKRQTMVQQMMKEMFDDKGVKLSDITDAEIQAYYDTHPTEFKKPEQRRASHILFKDRARAEATLKKLQALPENMEAFNKAAKDHNQDAETKDREGDLRFFAREPAPNDEGPGPSKALREATFTLKKTGDLYPEVIQSDAGFHILKLTGERPALDRSVQDARRLIQNRLWRQKREASIEKYVVELRAKADVKENPELLSQVKVDVAKSPAAGSKQESGARAPSSADAAGKKK